MSGHPAKLHIVLHQPEIPQNTGNIGRTCVAGQCKLWIVRPCGFRLDDRNLRRAGLDYWEQLDWQAVNSWQTLTEQLPQPRKWYFSRHAEREIWSAAFQPGDVLVFGSESQGLPASITTTEPQRCLKIPMYGPVRSLNLSNAVAIATYEALRQLEPIPPSRTE